MKNILFLMILCPMISFATPAEDDFGEATGVYIGLCYGINILKRQSCPSVEEVNTSSCETEVLRLLPAKYHEGMKYAINSVRPTYLNDLPKDIARGFKKSMVNMNGDIKSACISYYTAINTMKYQKYEELKRMAKYLQ